MLAQNQHDAPDATQVDPCLNLAIRRAMAEAPARSRSPKGHSCKVWWAKVHEGNLVMVRSDQVQMPANVYNLLQAVREEAKRVLNGLDVGDLRLFPSHGDWSASQAHLGMATSVDEITGGASEKPLFVHYERQQAPEQATHPFRIFTFSSKF